MTPEPYDFRKPPPGVHEEQVAAWLAEACRRAWVGWTKQLPFAAVLRPGRVESIPASIALQTIPNDALAFRVSVSDPDEDLFLLALPRPLVLALVAGLLGDTPDTVPESRDLSALEESLLPYLVRELFLDPIERAWPALAPPQFTAGGAAPPRNLWRSMTSADALSAQLTIAAPFGEQSAYLLLPPSRRLGDLIGTAKADAAPAPSKDQMEALVREMAVDVSVVLGTADLTLSELGKLQAGDVVILGRKVTEPLDAAISGARKFRVWPGCVGDKHAIQIHATEG